MDDIGLWGNKDESSTDKLLEWSRKYEHSLFNKDAQKAKADRIKAQHTLQKSSTFYKKRLPADHVTKAQTTNFHLAPLFGLQATSRNNCDVSLNLLSEHNMSTLMGRFGLAEFPKRSAHLKWLLWWGKTNTANGQPIRETSSPTTLPTYRKLPPVKTRYSITESPACSTTSLIPILKLRNATKTFLIRRPTIERPIPLAVDHKIFKALTEERPLRALALKTPVETHEFYLKNYPLLLTSATLDGEQPVTMKRGSVMLEAPVNIFIKRGRLIKQTLAELDNKMAQMEKEPDNFSFSTQLHDKVFNPTSWPWTPYNAPTEAGSTSRRRK